MKSAAVRASQEQGPLTRFVALSTILSLVVAWAAESARVGQAVGWCEGQERRPRLSAHCSSSLWMGRSRTHRWAPVLME